MKKRKSVSLFATCIYTPLFFILLVNASSCTSDHIQSVSNANSKLEIIRIVPEEKLISINFNDYFSSWKIIPLETNSKSVIGHIKRISVFKSIYYVLDAYTNSVLMFNSDGKFLNKIQKIGNGEGEYVGLMDFTVDDKNNQIILYAHRPYKLLFFDLSGSFIREERMSKLYNSISIANDDILFLNYRVKDGFMISALNKGTKVEKKIMPMIKNSDYFERFRLNTPTLVRGIKTNISLPYSDTLYEAKNHQIFAKYNIDFGSKKLPENFLGDRKLSPSDIYKSAIDNMYGFGVSNFKELNDLVCFSYGPNICVFYFKKEKKTIAFNFVKNNETFLEFGNIFAHDGDDNNLISIYPSSRFKSRIAKLRESDRYNNLPANIKRIDSGINEVSNPLLLVYTLKNK